jgi:O-succinylbenzoic acid--CoA ligase
VAGGRTLTYAQLDAEADAEAARLSEAGVRAGQALAVPSRPALGLAVGLHAVPRAGAALVPYDPADAPPRLDDHPGAHSIVFTSGTTAEPRPVVLTRAHHQASARAVGERLGLGPEDRWLLCLPPVHVGGLAVLVRAVVHGSAVVVHERFEPEAVRATLERGEATHVSLVPTMLERLRRAGLRRAPGLRALLLGGGPMPQGLLDWADDQGLPLVPTYGMTETASAVALGRPARALDGVELRIADGEILVRGPMVAAEGWLHTGDLGRLDERGRLTVEGRLKDTIISGGENVAPVRVEAALESHPAVAEAAVLGLADPDWGEAVTALVVAAHAVGERELIEHARERLRAHEVPKAVRLVDSLPRNRAGKLLRGELSRVWTRRQM